MYTEDPDNPDRFPSFNFKTHMINGSDKSLFGLKLNHQIFDL